MLIVRVPRGIKSGRSRAAPLNGESLLVLNKAPPPGKRHEPTSAGRQTMFRTAMPPPP
jgi:hypothetical protein